MSIDLLLMSLFAIQHSVMARKPFKRWWTQFIPKSVERSTYVLFVQPALLTAVLAMASDAGRRLARRGAGNRGGDLGAVVLGWVIVLTSTFMINHFELFGLHQVANNLAGREMPPPSFRTPFLYKFVRHPIYLGFIIAFWAAPTMSVGHLLFAAVTTAYIFVGILLEERDLIDCSAMNTAATGSGYQCCVPWRKSI